MGVEKRKSNANAGSPAKFAKPSPGGGNNFGKPGGGGGKFGKGGSPGGGKPFGNKGNNNFGGKGPGGQGQGGGKFGKGPRGGDGKPQQGQPQRGSPVKDAPPPPPQGAKKLNVEVVKPAAKQNQKKQNAPHKGNKNGLNKVSDQSKKILKTPKKNRFQRLYNRLDLKVRSPGDCERAQKAEQELVHSGRAFTIKVADPPITQDIVKGWSSGIETAVFTRPVEPRQFLIVFKPNTNIKKELETLKKLNFAGGKVQVEEKIDRGSEVGANPEAIDPYSLYVSNLHESVTKESLGALFPKATTVTPPRKHNPKLGSSTKFAFISFDSAADALQSFKESYQAVLNGNSIVMRFRRVAAKELHHIKEAAAAPVEQKKAPVAAKGPAVKKGPVKAEPESDDDDDDEESDDEDEEVGAAGVGPDEDDDDDDEDDDDDDEGDEEEDDDDEDDEDDD
jgi:hypothetical protein